jgi:transcriptional regulator with XRE-family HTH domain
MEFDKKAAGERLASARGKKARHVLAVEIGVSPDTIGRWERGEASVSPEFFGPIGEALGVDFTALYMGSEVAT